MSKSVSYTKLESTLTKLGAQLNAAETHGLLTGMLSLSNPNKAEVWRDALLENLDCATPSKSQWNIISAASTQIQEDFTEHNFGFKLLLPDDDIPLNERVDALSLWCRGYLSGLGLVGVTKEDLANEVIQELVNDISHIAHVSIETDSSEDDESNYMELVEYIRVAVQNIQVELKTNESSRMLH
jgi:yecA family protein